MVGGEREEGMEPPSLVWNIVGYKNSVTEWMQQKDYIHSTY